MAVDALRLATLGGAEALELADRVGSLENGKDADIAVFAINRIEAIPEFEHEAFLIHARAGAVQASHVLAAGRTPFRDGTIVSPVDGLYDRVKALGARLAGWRVLYRRGYSGNLRCAGSLRTTSTGRAVAGTTFAKYRAAEPTVQLTLPEFLPTQHFVGAVNSIDQARCEMCAR